MSEIFSSELRCGIPIPRRLWMARPKPSMSVTATRNILILKCQPRCEYFPTSIDGVHRWHVHLCLSGTHVIMCNVSEKHEDDSRHDRPNEIFVENQLAVAHWLRESVPRWVEHEFEARVLDEDRIRARVVLCKGSCRCENATQSPRYRNTENNLQQVLSQSRHTFCSWHPPLSETVGVRRFCLQYH